MDMKHMKILFACLIALALHHAAWAEEKVYETTNAQGNKVFTDSPPMDPSMKNAETIELQPTNTADAPPPQPRECW